METDVENGRAASSQTEYSALVLLVVPGQQMAQALEEAVAFHGLVADRVESGAAALARMQQVSPDLIVLDLDLPDIDGLVLCSDLRSRTDVPIIVTGERDQKREALLAFRLGADDFVAKPFDLDDLVARAEALLRRAPGVERAGMTGHASDAGVQGGAAAVAWAPRSGVARDASREVARAASRELRLGRGQGMAPRRRGGMAAAAALSHTTETPRARSVPGSAERPELAPAEAEPRRIEQVGDLVLDRTHHRVALGSHEVRLSRSEYLLLGALMARPDQLLSRLELAQAVWGPHLAGIGRPIDQHIYRLRNKLQRVAAEHNLTPPSIVAVPGFGYKLLTPTPLAAAS
jgi:DNA-binding response OmpR family regulator